jgi:hypothetical protein
MLPQPGQAFFEVNWDPASGGKVDVPCQFNPTQITLEKGVQYAEINIPGLITPLQQFVRGQAETLNLELMFDTSDQGMGINAVSVTTLTDQIYALARIDPQSHAPPVVSFHWGNSFPGHLLPSQTPNQHRECFTGIVTSVRQVFTLWSSLGVPLRAKVTLTMKEYISLNTQLKQLNPASPDKTHAHVLASGETLGTVANLYYSDCTAWRQIADANGIDDPRRLSPGRQINVPSIPSG